MDIEDTKLKNPINGEAASNEDPEAVGREEFFRLPISPISSPSGEVLFADGNRVLSFKPGTTEFRVYCGSIESGCRVGKRLKEARFDQIGGICLSPTGELFIADTGNHRIVIVRSDGVVEHYIGSNVSGGGASQSSDDIETNPLFYPRGMCLALSGDLLVADTGNHVIRRIDKTTKRMTTVAGQFGVSGSFEGWRSCAVFNYPTTVRMGCEGELIVTTKQLSDADISYSDTKEYKPSIWKIWPDGRVTQHIKGGKKRGIYDAIADFSTGNLIVLQVTPTQQKDDPVPSKSNLLPVFLTIPCASPPDDAKAKLESGILLPSSLFSQSSVITMLDALYNAIAAEDPKICASKASASNSASSNAPLVPYFGVIHLKIEGKDEYTPVAREFVKFDDTTPLSALYRLAEALPEADFILDHPKNVVLLGPDGVILQHSARPLQKIVSFFEAENVVYLNAVPPGSKEQHLNTNDAGCASNGPEVIVLEDDNIAYSQVPDLRGPYVRRIPLIFRIAPRKIVATLKLHSTRSDLKTDGQVDFEEENGFALHKLVKKAREKFGSSSNAIKLIKRSHIDFYPGSIGGCSGRTMVIDFCETNPIRLAVVAPGSNQTPFYITVTPATIVDHIAERFIYEQKLKGPYFKVRRHQTVRVLSFLSVSECRLKHGDTIYVDPSETNTALFVKTLTGANIPVYPEQGDTIDFLKYELHLRNGTPIDQMRLIYAGKQLEDSRSVSDYNMTKGDTVHLVPRLGGG